MANTDMNNLPIGTAVIIAAINVLRDQLRTLEAIRDAK